jgi:opacity protein-like surface antigen
MKYCLLLLFCALPMYCQSVSFGLKAGVPVTAGLGGIDGRSVGTESWTAGATVEFKLPANLSVGVDGLYRRFSYSFDNYFGRNDANIGHLEFPVFAKYRFGTIVPPSVARPFVEAGFVFDRARTSGTSVGFGGPPVCCGTVTTTYSSSQWGAGLLVGGGIEMKAAFLKIAPEVRYTRWQKGLFYDYLERNQVAVLVGVRF